MMTCRDSTRQYGELFEYQFHDDPCLDDAMIVANRQPSDFYEKAACHLKRMDN